MPIPEAKHPTPASCREALAYLGAGYDPGLTTEQAAQCSAIARFMTHRPLAGLVLQQLILHHYLAAHGQTDLKTTINWPTVLEWLVQNMPTILKMLLAFVAAFGGTQPDPTPTTNP